MGGEGRAADFSRGMGSADNLPVALGRSVFPTVLQVVPPTAFWSDLGPVFGPIGDISSFFFNISCD